MKRDEVYKRCIALAEEIEESYPQASLIIGVVGCMTAAFAPKALDPIADSVADYGKIALGVMNMNMDEEK